MIANVLQPRLPFGPTRALNDALRDIANSFEPSALDNTKASVCQDLWPSRFVAALTHKKTPQRSLRENLRQGARICERAQKAPKESA